MATCRGHVGLLLATVLAACAGTAPSAGPAPAQGAAEVPLQPYFRALRTVEVTHGRDTLRFLLDTGGGHTLLTPRAAQRLGCTPFGRSIGHRMSGERVEFQWCAGVALSLAGQPLGDGLVAVFDLEAVLPPPLPRLDGLLSLASFRGRAVTVDLAGERLVLETPASAAVRRESMAPLTARTATGEDGSSLAVLLAARAETGTLWLLLDSGNLVGTLLAPHAARQLGLPAAPREEESPRIPAALEILGLPPRQDTLLVRDLIYDGVLGADFFLRHEVTFDLRGSVPWVGAAPGGGTRTLNTTGEAMRSFRGIYTVLYRVPDLERAKAWYAQAFGTAPYFDEAFYAGFNIAGYELGLIPAEGGPVGAGGVVAYWGVDDVDAAVDRLTGLGATLQEAVQDVGGGVRVATVLDPFGNPVGIIENPQFGRPVP